jgi:hypothetical protein
MGSFQRGRSEDRRLVRHALGPQYGVVGVVGARRRASGSWSDFVDQDGPAVVEKLDDIAGLVVVEGVEA